LQEAAKARGEPMTREDADYAIDKALASTLHDSCNADSKRRAISSSLY
jgi:hypothetical protein